MILLFAHKYRAYIALGFPDSKSSKGVKIAFTRRIQVSIRRQLIDKLWRELRFERVWPMGNFHVFGDTEPMFQRTSSEWAKSDLPHLGFAIYATDHGFALRSVERVPSGGWVEASKDLTVVNGVLPARKSDGSLELVVSNAAALLCKLVRGQKRQRKGELRQVHLEHAL